MRQEKSGELLSHCYGVKALLRGDDELMMRLALSVIIFCAVFVFQPVAMNIMEHPLNLKSAIEITFD